MFRPETGAVNMMFLAYLRSASSELSFSDVANANSGDKPKQLDLS
jgi:hypothetical protein